MEKGKTLQVLDHGYVKLIEWWGGGLDGQLEAGIVEAARQSTQGGFRGWGGEDCPECTASRRPGYVFAHGTGEPVLCARCNGTTKLPGDERLLHYLATHKHTTPFEFAGAVFEVQAPILVFREWMRHRTQSYSEASARYEPIPDVNYLPTRERIIDGARKAGRNRQAQGTQPLNEAGIADWLTMLEASYRAAESTYQAGLALGIPKEVARVIMPVGRYSKMRVTTDLWNWMHFLTLRTASDAQWEIRQYATAVEQLLAELFPRSMTLWFDMVHGPDAH